MAVLDYILIVDDNRADRILLEFEFERLGLARHIQCLEHGGMALDFLSDLSRQDNDGSGLPSIIFLDVNMPYMDGFQFLSEFAKLKNSIPILDTFMIIVLVSVPLSDDAEQGLAYPFVRDSLVKMDISADHLQELVEKCLSS
ncbi:MAG: response regulator [Gammaproteobacteria bacterium]|nr:response regulator [Gammaproteobacteria bacterium]